MLSVLSDAQILTEIQNIMAQNAYTKDVFREMDGFLGLHGVLSTLRTSSGISQVQDEVKKLEGVQLVLEILSSATFEHSENAKFYKVSYSSSWLRRLLRLVTEGNWL